MKYRGPQPQMSVVLPVILVTLTLIGLVLMNQVMAAGF